MATPEDTLARAEHYVQRRGIQLRGELGSGKDGAVWLTSRRSALKIHRTTPSYWYEVEAYIRLREMQIRNLNGLTIPLLLDKDDELLALEMDFVTPPFALDFASARLDFPPDLIEDEGHTLEDLVLDRFGDRAADVLAFREALIELAGIYLTDLHPHNIKFARPADAGQ